MEITDWVEKVRQGDHSAFELVVREYQQKIYVFCFFMLSEKQEAEDAVQDIFFKAYRHLPSYRENHVFLSWLYKIAANHCKTLLKRKNKRNHLQSILQKMFHTENSVKSAEETYQEIDETDISPYWLTGLASSEKEILILKVIGCQSFEEISKSIGAKPATVRKRFERLRKKLEKKVEYKEELQYEQRVSL